MASASFRSTVVAPRRALSFAIGLAACQIALLASGCGGGGTSVPTPPAAPGGLTLHAPFANGATIPTQYTCSGRGRRPALVVRRVPPRARELVLLVTDPDAPSGTFVHWTAYGIPPEATTLPDGGRQGRNTAGGRGWTPPCPPKGDPPHHYVFAVYALAKPTGLAEGATADEVIDALGDAIARGQVTGRFARS